MTQSITIDNINNVLAYKHLFEGDTSHLCISHKDAVRKEDGEVVIDMDRIAEYSPDFYKFIDALQVNNFIILVRDESHDGSDDDITHADISTLLTLITANIRAEHLCTGIWAGLIKNGFFLRALSRLEELRDEMVKNGQTELELEMEGNHGRE